MQYYPKKKNNAIIHTEKNECNNTQWKINAIISKEKN